MAIAFQANGNPIKDGNVYFLRPEGNPSGLVTSLEGRANIVPDINTNVVGISLNYRHLYMDLTRITGGSGLETTFLLAGA